MKKKNVFANNSKNSIFVSFFLVSFRKISYIPSFHFPSQWWMSYVSRQRNSFFPSFRFSFIFSSLLKFNCKMYTRTNESHFTIFFNSVLFLFFVLIIWFPISPVFFLLAHSVLIIDSALRCLVATNFLADLKLYFISHGALSIQQCSWASLYSAHNFNRLFIQFRISIALCLLGFVFVCSEKKEKKRKCGKRKMNSYTEWCACLWITIRNTKWLSHPCVSDTQHKSLSHRKRKK